jgi:hypothetical protein
MNIVQVLVRRASWRDLKEVGNEVYGKEGLPGFGRHIKRPALRLGCIGSCFRLCPSSCGHFDLGMEGRGGGVHADDTRRPR